MPLYVSSKDNPEEMEEFSLGLNVGLNHSLSSLTSQISKAINIDPIPQFKIQVSLALLVGLRLGIYLLSPSLSNSFYFPRLVRLDNCSLRKALANFQLLESWLIIMSMRPVKFI